MFNSSCPFKMGFPSGSVVKNPPANAGDASDAGLIPGLGRSPRGGNGNSLQHSCLENPNDRGAWRATVHGATEELYMTEHAHSLRVGPHNPAAATANAQ